MYFSGGIFMREVQFDQLKIGDVLAHDIYTDYAYTTLLAKGTAITKEHLQKLREFNAKGYCMVLEAEVPPGLRSEILDKVADQQIKRAYLDTFIVGKSIFDNMARGNPINVKLVCEVVDVLVDQMLRSDTLLLQLAAVRLVDDYTFSHMVNSALYAAAFGRCLGLTTSDIRDLCLAGLLHDVGKAKVAPEILRKPGELNNDELSEIKKHPEYAYAELCKCPELNERVRQAALQHHERGNGSGYPRGLKQANWSLFARIIAIVDVYDALTSDRCYRGRVLPHESADILMGDCSANRLDTDLVRVFLKHIARYPLGAEVVLSDGRRARIIHIHPQFPLRPVVEILEQNVPGSGAVGEVDLMMQPTLFIASVLS
jgi:HD-GYP domain-containing protein (c-di-GMP phosphodiesterase class II)